MMCKLDKIEKLLCQRGISVKTEKAWNRLKRAIDKLDQKVPDKPEKGDT
jgi:hypothetical protein